MFAPNSNTIIDNNLVISTPYQQFSHFVTPNQQNPNYSFFNSPSHFLDHDDFFLDNNNVLPYQSPPPPPTTTQGIENPSEQPRVPEKEKEIKEKAKGKRKRAVVRRTGKKDRHSKIHTAHGPRDRRMRLSLQIARKFFDLQDMLGFDKASKTIEWLFNKSKAAIKDLADRSCTTILIPSSPSNDGINGANNNSNSNNKQRKSKSGLFQKKENREKARARARERTKEKLIMMQKQGSDSIVVNTSTNEQNPSENNNNIIEVNEYGFCQNNNGQQPLEEQMASVGIIEKFLTPSSSSSIFDFDHNDVHQDQVLSRSCDSIMIRSSNAIGFDDFAASWVTGNERISGAEFESNSSANCAFMGRPFNCKEGMKY